MNPAVLLENLRGSGVVVTVTGDQLRVRAPKGRFTAEMQQQLKDNREDIVRLLEADAKIVAFDPCHPPLSFEQESLWMIARAQPDSAAYNSMGAVWLLGRLEVDLLERAANDLLARHDVLRATFTSEDGRPRQRIGPPSVFRLGRFDLGEEGSRQREAVALELARQFGCRPFDLEEGPLLRAALLDLDEERHLLALAAHHIVSDGWSIGLMLRELAAMYGSFLEGKPSPIPELSVQYGAFASTQRDRLDASTLRSELDAWREILSGIPLVLELPTDRPRSGPRTFQGGRFPFQLPDGLLRRARQLAAEERATTFMVLVAAFQAVLGRYTGNERLVIGTPITTRSRQQFEHVVGMFANTIVLPADLSGRPSFRALIGRTREGVLGAFAHREVPFELLVRDVRPPREVGRNPIFQVMFSLQPVLDEGFDSGTVRCLPVALDPGASMFDVSFCLQVQGDDLHGYVHYSADLFDEETIAGLVGSYHYLLAAALEAPDRHITDLPVYDRDELRQLQQQDISLSAYSDQGTVHALIEAQAERTPHAVAVIAQSYRLSYQELEFRAEQLARVLLGYDLGPETFIAICVGRVPALPVAMLGVLKAGAAYVGIETAVGSERLDHILVDLAVPIVIVDRSTEASLPVHVDRIVLDVTGAVIPVAATHRDRPVAPRAISPAGLAYAIYTSGSTGVPKAVGIEHRQAVSFLHWAGQVFSREDLGGVLATTSPEFDCVLVEILAPLSWGGTVVLARSAIDLPFLGDGCAVSLISAVPSVVARLLDDVDLPSSVRRVHVHGEVAGAELLGRLYAAREGIEVWNCYGPSETTTYSTVAHLSNGEPPTIGRPILGTRVYVLDDELNPVPVGVPGELYIGGLGVSRGYLNQPGITATRFVADPLGDVAGGRLYRTGDLVRRTRRGDLVFLGRRDRQVKLRGIRVEPGEIEAALSAHPGVSEAVVVGRGEGGNVERLEAFVVATAAPPSQEELCELVRQKMSRSVVPDLITMVPSLPRTPNGKVDIARLPSAPPAAHARIGWWRPRDYIESGLLQIWQSVLEVEEIGPRDDFFALGGHSLLILVALARIQSVLGANISVDDFLASPTIEGLARQVRIRWVPIPRPALVRVAAGGTGPPLFCVHAGQGDIGFPRNLLQKLDLGRPVYGFCAIGFDGCQEPLRTVEEMAERYVRELREVQPVGPYLLAGYCLGGLVAFEMAQRLIQQGDKVDFLGLIDTAAPSRNLCLYGARATSGEHADNLAETEMIGARIEQLQRELGEIGSRTVDEEQMRIESTAKMMPSVLRRMAEIFVRNLIAARSYVLYPYPGSIAFFRADNEGELEGLDRDWLPYARGGLAVFPVDEDHNDIDESPALGELLRSCLDRAISGPTVKIGQ